MKLIFGVLALLFCLSAHSGSLEDATIAGMAPNGEPFELKYDTQLAYQKKLGDFFVGPKIYGYCSPGGSSVQDEYFLYCSKSIGAEPTLVYRSPPYTDPAKRKTALYKKAEKLCARVKSSGCEPTSYYVCIQGCGPEFSDLLVDVYVGGE